MEKESSLTKCHVDIDRKMTWLKWGEITSRKRWIHLMCNMEQKAALWMVQAHSPHSVQSPLIKLMNLFHGEGVIIDEMFCGHWQRNEVTPNLSPQKGNKWGEIISNKKEVIGIFTQCTVLNLSPHFLAFCSHLVKGGDKFWKMRCFLFLVQQGAIHRSAMPEQIPNDFLELFDRWGVKGGEVSDGSVCCTLTPHCGGWCLQVECCGLSGRRCWKWWSMVGMHPGMDTLAVLVGWSQSRVKPQ